MDSHDAVPHSCRDVDASADVDSVGACERDASVVSNGRMFTDNYRNKVCERERERAGERNACAFGNGSELCDNERERERERVRVQK